MTIEELNEAVRTGEIDELIRVCEARQVKALSALADQICAKEGVRLVLLCGGSSAGKTTTAKRLCTQLRVNGATALHMSTDDYFVGDARNPRHPDGTFDYETIEAVDSARLSADLNALLAGEAVHMRRFDFVRHEGYDSESTTKVPDGGYIVLEGIHALNPLLAERVPEKCKFRIFIEPKTQLTIFALTKLLPQDGRLLRRLVRDNQFRKMSPFETFDLWPQVLDGEDKWINPYRPLADAEFDSGLEYELAVMKPFAAGLVEIVRRRRPEEKKAYMFTELFEVICPAHPTAVPGDSILRETIGGSQLEY
jgi:uridine kinase